MEKKVPSWIKFVPVKNIRNQELFASEVDLGEASAFALSLEIENSLILIDDLRARKLAKKMNLNFSGTFGLILAAKNAGVISKVLPIIKKIRMTDFRYSDKMIQTLLNEAGE